MKKTLLIILGFTAINLNAQVFNSNFATWATTVPTDWMGTVTSIEVDSVNQITTGAVFGANACELVNTEVSHKRFTTQPLSLTGGNYYDITFWVKGQGDIRAGIYDGGYTYGSYITVNSNTWTQYTQSVGASTTTSTGEIMISVRNTVSASGNLQLDSVAVSVGTPPSTTTIYAIQNTTTPPYDSPLFGTTVSTNGIVTATATSGYFVQDGVGAWNGVYVYDNINTPSIGDDISFSAYVDEYFNLTELKNVVAYTVNSTGNTLPAATVVSTLNANDEMYEGVLIQVVNATCTSGVGVGAQWIVNDGSGDIFIDDMIYPYTPVVSNVYDVTGVLFYSFSEWKIEPRDINDIVNVTGVNELYANDNVRVYPNPATNVINISFNTMLENASVKLFDLSGKLIMEQPLTDLLQTVTIESLTPGYYTMMINSNKGVTSLPIIKK